MINLDIPILNRVKNILTKTQEINTKIGTNIATPGDGTLFGEIKQAGFLYTNDGKSYGADMYNDSQNTTITAISGIVAPPNTETYNINLCVDQDYVYYFDSNSILVKLNKNDLSEVGRSSVFKDIITMSNGIVSFNNDNNYLYAAYEIASNQWKIIKIDRNTLKIVTTSANIVASDVYTILTKDSTFLYVVISNTNSTSRTLIQKLKKSDLSVAATSTTFGRDSNGRSFEDNSYLYIYESGESYRIVNKSNLAAVGSGTINGIADYFAVTDKYIYTSSYIVDKSDLSEKRNLHRVGDLICGEGNYLFWFQENGKYGGTNRDDECLSGRIVITDESTSKVVYATSTIYKPTTRSLKSIFTYDDNNLYVFDLKTHAIIKFAKNDQVMKNIIGYHKE